MAMINCMIVDDEEYAVQALKRLVEKTPFLNLVHATTSPLEAIGKLSTVPIDLVFLDMHMGELDGLDFLKAVKGKAFFILCTAHSAYAAESYEYGVVDYLLKPILYARFLSAVQKVLEKIERPKEATTPADAHFFVREVKDNKYVKVYFSDIAYIESVKNYLYIFLKSGKLMIRMTMREMELTLPQDFFMRVHASFFVPVKKIIAYDNSAVTIEDVDRQIPVSERYREPIEKALKIN